MNILILTGSPRPNGNSNFLAEKYGVNAQPAYIIVNHEGTPLMPVRGYDLDIQGYIKFLNDGIAAFRAQQQ